MYTSCTSYESNIWKSKSPTRDCGAHSVLGGNDINTHVQKSATRRVQGCKFMKRRDDKFTQKAEFWKTVKNLKVVRSIVAYKTADNARITSILLQYMVSHKSCVYLPRPLSQGRSCSQHGQRTVAGWTAEQPRSRWTAAWAARAARCLQA